MNCFAPTTEVEKVIQTFENRSGSKGPKENRRHKINQGHISYQEYTVQGNVQEVRVQFSLEKGKQPLRPSFVVFSFIRPQKING